MFANVILFIQLFFTIVMGIYFLNLLKSQQNSRQSIEKDSKKEMDKLKRLRDIKLTEPLSEKSRPTKLEEIIGQEEGVKALKAAICGPNPQHIIIFGPPGIGKTAAARIVLEEAKKNAYSPFKNDAKFIELDATTLRYDERSIADPLMGSVHDPIYQGAGAYGAAGIPQPKIGAVTKAHGGILFLDEIGELQSLQLNKLLKVLEDRKVFLESAYYNCEDKNIPTHIHDIFQKGLPADFRLIGATTRSAEDIPPALRSRCVEIYFRPLYKDEIKLIAKNCAIKAGFKLDDEGLELISKYATNGREAVNIVQIAGSVATLEKRDNVTPSDIEWVINAGKYIPRYDKKVTDEEQIGFVYGLAVSGSDVGLILDIECTASKVHTGDGTMTVTGLIEQEEISNKSQKLRRTSSAKASVENVLTVLNKYFSINFKDYNIHLNFPGAMPIDGPSAGVAILVAMYSAIKNLPVPAKLALTGEISIKGNIKPVGGVIAKVEAARLAGITKVYIPKDNYKEIFKQYIDIRVLPEKYVVDLIDEIFMERVVKLSNKQKQTSNRVIPIVGT